MAFARPDRENRAMMDLYDALPPDLHPVYNYFERYYVGHILSVRLDGTLVRMRPRFPRAMWTVYDRTLRGEGRMKNLAQAAHRRLQQEFAVSHPSIWKFIDGIRKVQHNRDSILERFNTGGLPTPKNRRYLDTDRNLLHIVRTIDARTNCELLRGVAQNFLMD